MKRVSCLLALSLSLAACGGGGGSGGGSATPALPVQQPQAKVQQVPTQRALAQQSLQTQLSTQDAVQYGISGGTTVFSGFHRALEGSARRVTSAWRAGAVAPQSAARAQSVTYGPCTNGSESATVQVSTTEEQLYDKEFYDAACTTLYQDIFVDVIAADSTSATANGTVTEYSRTGSVIEYATLALKIAGAGTSTPSITLSMTQAPDATSPQTAAVGLSCGLATASAACGFGAFARIKSLSQDEGVTLNLTLSATVANSITTVPVTGNAAAYSGALNSLALSPGTFPAWSITGGSLLDTVSFNGQFAYTSTGLLNSGTLTLADSADDATVTLSSSSGTFTGTVKQTSTGTTVATFTVNAAGTGTISYSNGTTAQIVGWNVVG